MVPTLFLKNNKVFDYFELVYACERFPIRSLLHKKKVGIRRKIRKYGKDQESIQSSTTPDPGYLTNGKVTTAQLDIKNESQEVSP